MVNFKYVMDLFSIDKTHTFLKCILSLRDRKLRIFHYLLYLGRSMTNLCIILSVRIGFRDIVFIR